MRELTIQTRNHAEGVNLSSRLTTEKGIARSRPTAVGNSVKPFQFMPAPNPEVHPLRVQSHGFHVRVQLKAGNGREQTSPPCGIT